MCSNLRLRLEHINPLLIMELVTLKNGTCDYSYDSPGVGLHVALHVLCGQGKALVRLIASLPNNPVKMFGQEYADTDKSIWA